MKKSRLLALLYLGGIIVWAVYSFSRVDPNLTLFANFTYQQFQKVMTNLGFINRPLAAVIYGTVISFLFLCYYLLYKAFKKGEISLKQVYKLVGLSIFILVFSYPALSHDIFNYIFNAKMVLVYHANPHISVAMDFVGDPWTRFMHNIHTPAPYFYGWTVMSLIPSYLGFGKFILNLINFKLFEVVFFALAIYLLNKILKKVLPAKRKERLALLVLNPLVLIETFGNGHNDFVMISLALASLWFLVKEEKVGARNLLLSFLFLALSASTKYVTIVLAPLYLIYAFRKKIDIGTIGAIILFLVIFTRPADQFHPWYLIWSLSFAVFSRSVWVCRVLLFFSFALMLRYLPWIYSGGYSQEVLAAKTIITYSVPILLFVLYRLWPKNLSIKKK